MTKVNVISGFLGAGKTTLIKKLLDEALKGEKLVLIENEFGEIGIDGGFLKDAGVEISEMNSGCICCSLVGDFGEALKKVMDQFHPDRILIEPSGVGKLSDVIRAVQGVAEQVPEMSLGCAVTVADASKAKVYLKNFGEFYANQVQYAGAIILSRTQKLDAEKLEAAVALLREKNEKAPIVTTPWDQLTGAQLLAAMEKGNTLAEDLLAEEEAPSAADTTTIMRRMSTTITTMKRAARATMTTIMTTSAAITATKRITSITITTATKRAVSAITTTTMATSAATTATTGTIITTATMPARCSPAGAWRPPAPSPPGSWRAS